MSRLPRTRGLRSRPFPGPWAFAQAAPLAAQVRLSSTLNNGGILRPSAGRLQCLHSLPVQGVQSLPQLGIFVFVWRKRRSQCNRPSPRTPTAICNRQPRAPSGGAVSFLPSATCPSCAAFLGGEPPLSPLRPTGPSPPRPTPGALISVLRNLDRSALRLQASFEKQTYSSSSGSAAAVGAHHWITP